MFIIYLENYPQPLRGKLKTYLYEIKPALYVGTVSAQTRDLVWTSMIESENNLNAALIYPDKTEQGFSVRIHGEPKRKISDFGGLLAVTYGEWLKLDMLKSKSSTKPLICHFYETAYTADCLMDGYLHNLLINISIAMQEDVQSVKNIILFFAFLHDIGKIHPAFQYKLIPDVLNDFGYEYKSIYDGFRHEIYSEKLLDSYINKTFGKLPKRNLVALMPQVIKCHHQGKQPTICPLPIENGYVWEAMQDETVTTAQELFPFSAPSASLRELGNGIFEILVGIINLSDWIASTQSIFDEKTPNDFKDIEAYITHLKEQCNVFLQSNLMDNVPLIERFHNNTDFWKLLLNGFSPRPMQQAVESFIDSDPHSSLLFIEDSCGGGKTEAALYYALAQTKNAGGIYFALPTTATSDNMRARISEICKKGIDAGFKVPVYNSMAWMQDDDVMLDSNLWENNARLKLFYPIEVGTVDQLLMAVQGVKYSDLGLIALSNKTIVIDEMHAYDSYMLEELKTLFSYCSLMGVTIIVLSATMTNETKRQLIAAYNIAKDKDEIIINGHKTKYGEMSLSSDYPLITKVTNEYVKEVAPSINKQNKYEYDMFTVSPDSYLNDIWQQSISMIQDGGTLAVVVNTVSQAIEIYRYIKDKRDKLGLDIDLDLLHSRFSLNKKAQKTQSILTKYGKDRTSRPRKSILVSTQIIEQSLDVDFDYMITEIAPIDLIWQRFGRIRRHSDIGTIRDGKVLSGPSTYIFSWDNEFGKSSYVYEKSILSATLKSLSTRNTLISPTDVRGSIETVYSKENINRLEQLMQSQKANTITIGKVDYEAFWRASKLTSLKDDPHTRLEALPSTNVILLNAKQIERLINGKEISISEFKEIIKTQMYSSVALYKLEGLGRVEVNDERLNEYQLFDESQFVVSDEVGLQI